MLIFFYQHDEHDDRTKTMSINQRTGTREITYREENVARRVRRELINSGNRVSLLAYDASRRLYVFALYED